MYSPEDMIVDKQNKTSKEKIIDFYHEVNGLMGINIIWFLLCLPIVTIPPAMVGMFYAAYKNKKGEFVDRSTFFEGFKKYAGFSYIHAAANLMFGYLFLNGFLIYTNMEWKYGNVFASLLGLFSLLWLLLQIFSLPIVFEMKTTNYFYALQNSLLLLFLKPGRAITTLLLNLVVLALSIVTFFPLIFLTGAIISMITISTMDDALKKLNKTVEKNRKRMGLDEEKTEEEDNNNEKVGSED